MTDTLICKGRLGWDSAERITDRYGAVSFYDTKPGVSDLPELAGTTGTLKVKVLATHPVTHLGDWLRGISASVPEVGEEITLGQGELFYDVDRNGIVAIGVLPKDGRESDWLDPHALYHCHGQDVELWFETKEKEVGNV